MWVQLLEAPSEELGKPEAPKRKKCSACSRSIRPYDRVFSGLFLLSDRQCLWSRMFLSLLSEL